MAGRGLPRIIVEKAGQRQLITGTAFKYVIVGLMLTFLAHHRLLLLPRSSIFSQHLSSHSRTRLEDISFAAGKCINLCNLAAQDYKNIKVGGFGVYLIWSLLYSFFNFLRKSFSRIFISIFECFEITLIRLKIERLGHTHVLLVRCLETERRKFAFSVLELLLNKGRRFVFIIVSSVSNN